MKTLAVIVKVLSRRNYFLIFILGGILYGLLYAVMTNLVNIRFGNINFSFTAVSIWFIASFSILGGVIIALQIFAVRNRQKSVKSANIGFLGAFLSFFNVTCPFCKPLLLSFISFSGSLAILKFGLVLAVVSIFLLFGLVLAVVSIFLLLTSIYFAASQIEKSKSA